MRKRLLTILVVVLMTTSVLAGTVAADPNLSVDDTDIILGNTTSYTTDSGADVNSLNTDVVTVDESTNTLEAVGTGEARIRATLNGKAEQVTVTVTEGPKSHIVLNAPAYVDEGGYGEYNVTLHYENGYTEDITDDADVQTANESVAIVNRYEHRIVGQGVGTTNITAEYDGLFAKITTESFGPYQDQVNGDTQSVSLTEKHKSGTITFTGVQSSQDVTEQEGFQWDGDGTTIYDSNNINATDDGVALSDGPPYTKGPYQNGSGDITLNNDTVNNNITIYGSSSRDITTASHSSSTSATAGSIRGVLWGDDGTKMYEVDSDNERVYQLDASTAYDVTSTSYNSDYLDVPNGDIEDVAFNADGTQVYVVGTGNSDDPGTLYQYPLSTPYDLSSSGNGYSYTLDDGRPTGLQWGDGGNKLFVVGYGSDAIYEYSASTPYDGSTISLDTQISTQASTPRGVALNDDGTEIYVTGYSNAEIYQHDMSTPWDLSTASYAQSVGTSVSLPTGLAFNDDGSKMYHGSLDGDDVHEYDVTVDHLTDPSVTLDGTTHSHSGELADGENVTIPVEDLDAGTYSWSTSQSSDMDWEWDLSGNTVYQNGYITVNLTDELLTENFWNDATRADGVSINQHYFNDVPNPEVHFYAGNDPGNMVEITQPDTREDLPGQDNESLYIKMTLNGSDAEYGDDLFGPNIHHDDKKFNTTNPEIEHTETDLNWSYTGTIPEGDTVSITVDNIPDEFDGTENLNLIMTTYSVVTWEYEGTTEQYNEQRTESSVQSVDVAEPTPQYLEVDIPPRIENNETKTGAAYLVMSNGEKVDVTQDTVFSSGDESILEIEGVSKLTSYGNDGEVTVTVEYYDEENDELYTNSSNISVGQSGLQADSPEGVMKGLMNSIEFIWIMATMAIAIFLSANITRIGGPGELMGISLVMIVFIIGGFGGYVSWFIAVFAIIIAIPVIGSLIQDVHETQKTFP